MQTAALNKTYRLGGGALLCLLCCLLSLSSPAQTRSFFFDIKGPAAKGAILWQEGNYQEAILYLEQALKGGGRLGRDHLRKKLALAYSHTGNPIAAARVYDHLVEKGVLLEEKHLLLYANALMAAGKFEEGGTRLLAYLQSRGMEEQATALKKRGAVALLYQDSIRYSVHPSRVNSSGAEFSPYISGNGIIFVADRARPGLVKYRFAADNSHGLDLFFGELSSEGDIMHVQRLSTSVNSLLPEGPAVLAEKDKKIIFTRSGEKGAMGLYEAGITFNRSNWIGVQPIELSGKGATGHPAVAEDGRVLYFASDRPGGYGGIDLYRVFKTATGWSEAQNLGPKINTAGNEVFPTLGADGLLRFSSNGHFGLGGLDIYEARLQNDSILEVRNIGAPVNSPADDFGLSFHESGDWGFFSSNRAGGAGGDDLYRLNVHVISLSGMVKDNTNGKALGGARIRLMKEGRQLSETTSNAQGYYSFRVYPGEEYSLTFELEEYRDGSEAFSTRHGSRYGTRNLETSLDRKVKMFVLGTIRRSNREKAAGASLFVVDQQNGQVDTVLTGPKGDYELELDVSRGYTFLAECEDESTSIHFSTPEKGKASLSYYENLHLSPAKPYLLKGQVKASSHQAGPYLVSLTNLLSLKEEILITDEKGGFNFEAHPLADYELCLQGGGKGSTVLLKGGWKKAERRVELVY